MIGLLLWTLLSGCETEAAKTLRTCTGGNLNQCYRDGVSSIGGARPNFPAARQQFSAACMGKHHHDACHQLGVLLSTAKGGPADPVRAVEMFRIACTSAGQPHHNACVALGKAMYTGTGTEADPKTATKYFGDACMLAEPLPTACHALAIAYAEGKGVKKDEKRALDLFDRACEDPPLPAAPEEEEDPSLARKHVSSTKLARTADREARSKACVAGAMLQLKKRGRRDPFEPIVSRLTRACTLDARFGCLELGDLHANFQKQWKGASWEEASLSYQKACAVDPTHGCFEAAELMRAGHVSVRKEKIESLYNLACEHGNTDACDKRSL